jgi:hypothetical protein
MSTTSGVNLGTGVNLLMGLKTGWDPSDPASSPFFAPPTQGMTEQAADLGTGGEWGDPLITLHDSAESVLDAIYDVTIRSGTSDGANAFYGSGALLIRNADRATALAALQQQHGIDFAAAGCGYALIELRRESATAVHATFAPGVFKMPGADAFSGRTLPRAILKLPHAEQSLSLGWSLDTGDSAASYLDLFAQHGTHYVSSISGGDRILQVFAYAADQWKQTRSDFAASPQLLQGPNAYHSFLYYLRPLTKDSAGNVYGMVAQRGNITIASRDAAFAASVTAGQWREDRWAQGDCILAPWLGGAIQPRGFVKVVPIRVTLSPISLFMNHPRERAAWSVFRAAMATIYPDTVRPAFPGADDQSFDAVYPPRSGGLLSDLATPTIGAYVQRLDLASVQLAVPQLVKRFGIFANLLESRGAAGLSLPGGAITLLSHIVNVAAPADGAVPVLTVPDDAYATFALSCAKFVGGLFVTDAGGTRRKLIADGIVYERGPAGAEGRYTARATGDVHAAPALAVLQSLSAQLAAGLNGASAQLGAWQAMAPQGQVRLLIRFADWAAGLIPSDCPDQSLRALRLDALTLARAARALASGTRQVPYLTFKAYAPSVQAMNAVAARIQDTLTQYQDRIRLRKVAEAVITDLKLVNQNVIETGTLLTDYFKDCAQHQQDLAANYDAIAGSDQQTLTQTNQTIATLQSELGDQRAAVTTAIDKYKVAIGIKETEEIVKLSFEIAKGVFEVGFALATGNETEEAKKLKQMVEDIQKIVALIASIAALAQAIKGGKEEMEAADAAFTALGSAPLPTAALLKWDEFRVRMKNAVEKGPAMSERDDVVAAVDILVLRGKALVQTQESAAALVTRMFQERRRQVMAQDQSARMQKLTARLDPGKVGDLDLDDIDLVGMSGELDQLQSQMMAQLVRAAVIQDLALQYEYLQQPTTPPSSFDLISVGVYMAQQQGNLVQAKSALRPPPTAIDNPVSYKIGIPASALAGGRSFRFQIAPGVPEFKAFTMVRFSRLDLTVDGIGATDGGQFTVRLLYGGDPFYDRDQQHNAVTFSTSPRIMNYLGTVTPGQPSKASAGGDASGDYSTVTPFSDWEISFPADAVNAGLVFNGSVTLTLSFSLTAQINPSARARARARVHSAAAPARGSVQDMLTAMQGKSRLYGWDAVFNYTEDKVNALLKAEYDKLKKANQGHLVIPERTDTTQPDPTTGNSNYTTWSMTLGAPRVEFLDNNNQYATVYLDILDAKYEQGIETKDGKKIAVTVFPPPPLPPGAHIKGDVKLASAKGTVDKQSVVIDLPAGSWQMSLVDVSSGNPAFNTYLTNQLATVSTAYPLGTIATTANTDLPALTPTTFNFAVTKSDSDLLLLQLFIVTDGAEGLHLYLDEVGEPVPAGFDCSLMISSRILFDRILPASFVAAKSLLTIGGVDPNDAHKAWTAQAKSGSVSVPLSVTDSDYRIDSPASASMTGLSISPGPAPDYGLTLAGQSVFPASFTHWECTGGYYGGVCLSDGWVNYSVNVTTTTSAKIAFTVKDQEIQMTLTGDAQTDGDIDSGPCKGGPIQEKIVEAYRTAARPAIKDAVGVKLPAVSFMMLNNLLFPGEIVAKMSGAYAPGDIVLLGTLPT